VSVCVCWIYSLLMFLILHRFNPEIFSQPDHAQL
jgi:hypothetical protein